MTSNTTNQLLRSSASVCATAEAATAVAASHFEIPRQLIDNQEVVGVKNAIQKRGGYVMMDTMASAMRRSTSPTLSHSPSLPFGLEEKKALSVVADKRPKPKPKPLPAWGSRQQAKQTQIKSSPTSKPVSVNPNPYHSRTRSTQSPVGTSSPTSSAAAALAAIAVSDGTLQRDANRLLSPTVSSQQRSDTAASIVQSRQKHPPQKSGLQAVRHEILQGGRAVEATAATVATSRTTLQKVSAAIPGYRQKTLSSSTSYSSRRKVPVSSSSTSSTAAPKTIKGGSQRAAPPSADVMSHQFSAEVTSWVREASKAPVTIAVDDSTDTPTLIAEEIMESILAASSTIVPASVTVFPHERIL